MKCLAFQTFASFFFQLIITIGFLGFMGDAPTGYIFFVLISASITLGELYVMYCWCKWLGGDSIESRNLVVKG